MTAPILSNGDKTFTAKELTDLTAVITRQILEVQKHNASGAVATNNPPYGPYADGSGDYGVFSIPGIRPEMFSAFMRPRSLASILGMRKSLNANEKIGIMTGVTAAEGSNPSGFCGTAPTAGQLKRCIQNFTFGRSYWKSKVVNVAEAGEYVDYADVEKRVLNLQQNPNPFIPDIMARLDISSREGALLATELFTLGAAIERALERVLIRGNSTLTNANTQLGFISEFNGLERQITTGKRDLDSDILCPAADSQVITWGSGIDATVNGRTFAQTLVDTYFGLTDFADQMGLNGTRWVIVMPMRMFKVLTRLYACQYYVAYCTGTAGNPNWQNAEGVKKFEDAMWNGRYLLIDGQAVQVVFSDGILETRAAGSIFTAQEMFILPVEWQGMSTLQVQFKPMDNAEAMTFANFVGPNEFAPVNDGAWLATKARTNYCMELLFAGKMRLI